MSFLLSLYLKPYSLWCSFLYLFLHSTHLCEFHTSPSNSTTSSSSLLPLICGLPLALFEAEEVIHSTTRLYPFIILNPYKKDYHTLSRLYQPTSRPLLPAENSVCLLRSRLAVIAVAYQVQFLESIKMPMSPSSDIPSRADIENALGQISNALHSSFRPLPTPTADNTYLPEGKAKSNLLSEVKHLSIRNVQTLKDVLLDGLEGNLVDDRTYVMERVIQLAAELPLESKAGIGLTNGFLTRLWNDLGHPPLSSLGPNLKYRSADGSNNNPLYPRLGAAGNPYARTVRPETIQPIGPPDPGVVFDSLMARKTFKPHPNKLSSVLVYLASIITHDLFRTSHRDHSSTSTSSYLDLAPLYGSNQEDQDLIRTFKDGKIQPDTFSERRIHGFPSGVGVLLIMFNRFHNYTVEQLALINENQRFTEPTKSSNMDQYAKYDNDLFQTGRLITCGLYINIILKVRHSAEDETFNLMPSGLRENHTQP